MFRQKKSILIAANPKSGASDRSSLVNSLAEGIRREGYEATIVSDLELLRQQASQQHAEGILHGVIAAGGDGTVAAVVQRVAPDVTLGVFPLGTENLLSRYLRLPMDVESCVRSIQEGRTVSLDAGIANGRLFLLMLSAGFDADVVRRVHCARKGHIQKSTYFFPILQSIFAYRFPKISIQFTEGVPAETCQWLFAFNVPRYAGGLDIAPQSDPRDALLDFCMFQRGGLWRGLYYWWRLRQGRHTSLPDYKQIRASQAHITSDATIPFQMDGDAGECLPVDVRLEPARVRVWSLNFS